MAISVIQRQSNGSTSSTASVTTTLPVGLTAGSILVVGCIFGSGGTFTTLTFSGANTDSGQGVVAQGAGTLTKAFVKAFFAPVAGSTNCTVNFSPNTAFCGLYLFEVAGFTSAAFDRVIANKVDVNGTTFTSGSTGTLSAANEYAFAMLQTGSGLLTTDAGNGWSNPTFATSVTSGLDTTLGFGINDQIVSANTALVYSGTNTNDTRTSWVTTFMEAAPTLLAPVSSAPHIIRKVRLTAY